MISLLSRISDISCNLIPGSIITLISSFISLCFKKYKNKKLRKNYRKKIKFLTTLKFFLNISETFVPPKPNELDKAYSIS